MIDTDIVREVARAGADGLGWREGCCGCVARVLPHFIVYGSGTLRFMSDIDVMRWVGWMGGGGSAWVTVLAWVAAWPE